MRQDLGEISGVRAQPRVGGGLVDSRAQPIPIVPGGPEYRDIAQWRDTMMPRMEDTPGFFSLDSAYTETRPQLRVQIDSAPPPARGAVVHHLGPRPAPEH